MKKRKQNSNTVNNFDNILWSQPFIIWHNHKYQISYVLHGSLAHEFRDILKYGLFQSMKTWDYGQKT